MTNSFNQHDVDNAAREMLGNLLRAKAFFRRCEISQLESLIDAATQVLEDKREAEREAARKEAEVAATRAKLFDQITAYCEEFGMTYEQFMGTDPVKALKENRRASAMNLVKYKCTFKGKDYYWKGVGIPPKVFRACMQLQSVTKAAFLMEEKDMFEQEGRIEIDVPQEHLEELDRLCALYDKSHPMRNSKRKS
ncbi:hypothetical protein [Vibrio alginolyticus]|uniref:H-NS family histone-like protein n=1 Tax=Vibrio alginolyticus TaxID=663 RepID=UPI003D7CCD74